MLCECNSGLVRLQKWAQYFKQQCTCMRGFSIPSLKKNSPETDLTFCLLQLDAHIKVNRIRKLMMKK